MLPSSGYFKNIQCPYFKSGFCERSHCHFSHAKAASSSGRLLFGRCLPEGNKDFLDVFDRANLLRSTSTEKTLQNDCGTSYGEDHTDFDYVPTPVDSHAPKVSSILKKSKSIKYPSTVPEYRPTPISRLKPPGAPDSSDENSRESLSVSALSKKRKKVEEYDPTEVKCSFKKRVSFNLPSDDDKDDSHVNKSVPCVVLDSSDDDDGITPQFSDDEFEDDNVSDEASSPVIEKTDVMDFNTDAAGDIVYVGALESILPIPPTSEISSYSLVDKILTEVKKNETIEDVHKHSLKATSAPITSDSKDQKPHKSEIKDIQKSSSSKKCNEKLKKPVLKLKQELSSECVSQSRFKDEKLHKDSTKLHSNKKDNLPKCTTSKKPKTGESPVDSNKLSDKILLDKKHEIQNQNKVASKMHSTSNKVSSHSEERNKSQKLKIKSEHKEVDKKDRSITKHSDSLKSKNSTKISEKDPRNIVNIKKSSKDVEKMKKIKENVKIQDEKVSSSCHASHKKTTSSEKRHSSSPPKKKIKTNNDVKLKSPTVHKISHQPELPELDLKKNSDKEIQVNVQDSAEQINSVKSSLLHETSDSEEEVHFPACDSDMDSDTYEECLRIFNEHEQSQEQKEKLFQVKDEKEDDNVMSLGKKRVAHEKAVPKPQVPKQELPTHPSQVMHNRYLQLQGMYARQNSSDEKKVSSAFVNSTSKGIETIKKRITIAPNAGLVAAVAQKQRLLQSSGGNSSASNKTAGEITYVVTETKRVAHVPSQVLKPRPIIPVEYGCKVPSSVRQRYLNNFIDECLKFSSDQEEAYQMALDEEKKAYERSSNKTVYLNVAINTLKRLRNRAMETQAAGPPTSSFNRSPPEQSAAGAEAKMKIKTISHEMMLGGARAQRTSFSIEKKKPKIQDTEVKGKKLYDALMSYALTTEQLVENGYPLPHPAEPGRALVSGMYVNKRPTSNDPFKKVCSRCQKPYQIDENWDYVKKEECEYHWGHLWQKRIGRSMERQYSCCGGDSQSDGCCLGTGHVSDGDESETLKGYVKTLPKTPPPDGYFGVYALDCEMCYTTGGIELIRVTVINPDMKPVYESFVKPDNKILDYNTRFSGITEEQLSGVETSLRDVQAILLCLFNSQTILIGHSLESDFKALKLIHTTVVDTSVVFPHKRGLPYKRALRTLMAEYMRKIIQNSLEGHDSNEDAVACMELMLWKIKEDMKRNR